jgi:hypothetical protein
MRRPFLSLASLSLLIQALWPGGVALALDCGGNTDRELRRLALTGEEIANLRFVEKRNPTDNGPEVLGVRAWIRLKSCSGYLVIDMTRSCFVRQSYTRGDCRLEGVTAY